MRGHLAPLLYLLLLAGAVPWYWPADHRVLWFGLPAWVVVAIGVSCAASILTAALLARRWPGEDGGDD